MLDKLIRGLSRRKNGILLLGGAAAVLSGVERLLSTRPPDASVASQRSETRDFVLPVLKREDRFRVYKSQTDLGYAYWVLQGFGSFECFALFDSWEQAMQEAERRVAVALRLARVDASSQERPVLA